MDDDTWPKEDALAKLFEADKELGGNWGFLSSTVFWTDGTLCKANKPKKTLFTFIDEKDLSKNHTKILMGSFVSLLVRSSVVREVGLPIGEYFIWTDDYEFCGRISRKQSCYFIPSSRVVHAMKSNVKANIATDDISRMDRYRYLYRNDVHCYRQFGFMGWLYFILKDIYSLINVLVKSRNMKIEKIKVIFKGFKEGIYYNPNIKYVK